MKILSTNGIILRRINYGEADRIITMLTASNGKIRLIAKGVRKTKSKLAGGIELFSVSEIHFIKGKGDIDTLTSTRLLVNFGEIVKDLERTRLGYNMLKVIDKTLEDMAGQDYFDLLQESLAGLNNPRINPVLTELSFTMRTLQQLGHVPDFTTDVNGNSLNPEAAYEFDFEATAFVPKINGPFQKNHLKVMKLLAYNTPQSMAAVQGIEEYISTLAPLIRSLGNYHLQY